MRTRWILVVGAVTVGCAETNVHPIEKRVGGEEAAGATDSGHAGDSWWVDIPGAAPADASCIGEASNAVHHVPADFDSISGAVAGAADGDLICIAPGVWRESIDLGGRQLTLEGIGDSSHVLITGSPGQAAVLAHGPGSSVALRHLTLSGETALGCVLGGGLSAVHADVVLHDVVVTGFDVDCDIAEGTIGGGIGVWASNLWVVDSEVSHNRLWAHQAAGGGIGAIGSEVWLENVRVENNRVGYQPRGGGGISVTDGTLHARDTVISGNSISPGDGGDQLGGGGLYAEGTHLELHTVRVSDNVVDSVIGGHWGGGGVYLERGSLSAVGLTLAHNRITLSGTSSTECVGAKGGGLTARFWTDAGLSVVDSLFEGNTLSSTSPAECHWAAGAAVDLDGDRFDSVGPVTFERVAFVDHGAEAPGDGIGYVYGGTITAGHADLSLRQVAIRGSHVVAGDNVDGGVLLVRSAVSLEVEQAILADSAVTAPLVRGGVASVDCGGEACSLQLSQLDVFRNAIEARSVQGGFLAGVRSENVRLTNANLKVGPFSRSGYVSGTVGWFYDIDDMSKFGWLNIRAGGSRDEYWRGHGSGEDDVTGLMSHDPMYVDVSSPDSSQWDFQLQPGSQSIDAGDLDVQDADGSRSNLGAYGGPLGVW